MTDPKSERVTIDTNSSILSPHTPVICIRGEINEETAAAFREAVDELVYERHSEIALIELNSPGGEVLACFEILNIMKGAKIQWATYCASYAMSAAAVILSAGEPGRRFMSPLSTAMIHEVSGSSGWGHISQVRTSAKWMDTLNKLIVRELCENCDITLEEFTKRMKACDGPDMYLTPEEAKKFGLVDEVAIVTLAQSQAYQIEVIHEEGAEVNLDKILGNLESVVKDTKEEKPKAPKPPVKKTEPKTPKRRNK